MPMTSPMPDRELTRRRDESLDRIDLFNLLQGRDGPIGPSLGQMVDRLLDQPERS